PAADVASPGRGFTPVAVSWGEKEVFLSSPTWADLSPVTVLRIVGVGGEGLLHVEHYVRPAPSADFRPIRLSREQYRRLVAAIGRSLPRGQRVRYPCYGSHDVFYDAPANYTAT